jgi:hypothetical protein
VVGEAMRADPPLIRGLREGESIRRLVETRGEGHSREFRFDLTEGWWTYRQLLLVHDRVAIERTIDADLEIRFKSKFAHCPACGAVMPKRQFWDHYNDLHALRPGWLNEDHWPMMVKGEYRLPPEMQSSA